MQEDEVTVREVIHSTDLSQGIEKDGRLIAYGIVQATERQDTIYLYDVAVLPEFQRRGLATKLARVIFSQAREKGLKIRLHCRRTGYRLFGDSEKMREMGYAIVRDELRPDWYLKEFGIQEDAHELFLEPMHSSNT
jgi:GNAT superfamily N-acetyltransferase